MRPTSAAPPSLFKLAPQNSDEALEDANVARAFSLSPITSYEMLARRLGVITKPSRVVVEVWNAVPNASMPDATSSCCTFRLRLSAAVSV